MKPLSPTVAPLVPDRSEETTGSGISSPRASDSQDSGVLQPGPGSWPRRRWWMMLILIFTGQLALIFGLSNYAPPRIRRPAPAPELQFANGLSPELLALWDPTLFALPHRHGFSALVWNVRQPAETSVAPQAEPIDYLDFSGLGLGPGDEVITVAHTFAATANSIMFTGATPVFVDIEPDTYLIDAKRIEAAITPRTRAICPVHLFGLVADMEMIDAIAGRHGLTVVEDACQAHGATFRGLRAGSFGHGAFSLYATKNMTTGEGGFVTTSDPALADWLRVYRNQGQRSRYQFEMLGFNFRMTDITAAIGLVQLTKLDRNTSRRQALAARYSAALADLPIATPICPGMAPVFSSSQSHNSERPAPSWATSRSFTTCPPVSSKQTLCFADAQSTPA